MRILLFLKHFILILITIFLLLSMLSAYFIWKPSASVLTVPFRMVLQNTLKLQLMILPAIIVAYGTYAVVCRNTHKADKVTVICMAVLLTCLMGNAVTGVRVLNAKASYHKIEYNLVSAGTGRNKYNLTCTKNESDRIGVDQCKLYQDEESPYKDTVIIYMNYGGWSLQDESMGEQVYRFCEKEGYSFIRFGSKRRENEKIDTLIAEVDTAVNKLLKEEPFKNVFLCGGSAGAHIALLSAFKQSGDSAFPVEGISVDGVIALYPCVDPGYSYDYYIDGNEKKGLLDYMGDSLYDCLYPESEGGLAGYTKALDEQIFGIRKADHARYDAATIKNCISTADIPVLIVQGGADSMIAVDSVRACYASLCENDKTSVYLELPSTEHVFDLTPTMAWSRCENEMTAFVRRIL